MIVIIAIVTVWSLNFVFCTLGLCYSITCLYASNMQLGETALIHATWEGNVKVVRVLIAANASLSIRERVCLHLNVHIVCPRK